MAMFTAFKETANEVAEKVGGVVSNSVWFCNVCERDLVLIFAGNSDKNKRLVRKLYREGKVRSYAKF